MTNRPRSPFRPPRMWTPEELEADRKTAEDVFRQARMQEPLAAYLAAFAAVEVAVDGLFQATDDLARLDQNAALLLLNPDFVEVLRYLAAAPISLGDLLTLANVRSLGPTAVLRDKDLTRRVLETIRAGLDPRRFPWAGAGRAPAPAERAAAVLATTALIATRRVETMRRTEGKNEQEAQVRAALLQQGFVEVAVPGRRISALHQAPGPGSFCREVQFGERKADLVVGLWDHRVMPIECKVSNSATNSIKRLNNDAAVKAEVWRTDFGATQVVPVAVLSGVFKLRNLEAAQNRGLTLYWAYRLDDLVEWIESTRTGG